MAMGDFEDMELLVIAENRLNNENLSVLPHEDVMELLCVSADEIDGMEGAELE